MVAYPDTSVLVSLYVREPHSEGAIRLIGQFASSVVIAPLQEFEVANALELAVLQRRLTRSEADAARSNFELDLLHWTVTDFPVAAFTRAVTVARRHTVRYGTRSIDVLHVAAALLLSAEVFLTFDKRQRRLAKACGLRIH